MKRTPIQRRPTELSSKLGKMRKRRRVRRNPSDPAVTYWVVLSMIVVGGVAIWAWKGMSDKDKDKMLPGG